MANSERRGHISCYLVPRCNPYSMLELHGDTLLVTKPSSITLALPFWGLSIKKGSPHLSHAKPLALHTKLRGSLVITRSPRTQVTQLAKIKREHKPNTPRSQSSRPKPHKNEQWGLSNALDLINIHQIGLTQCSSIAMTSRIPFSNNPQMTGAPPLNLSQLLAKSLQKTQQANSLVIAKNLPSKCKVHCDCWTSHCTLLTSDMARHNFFVRLSASTQLHATIVLCVQHRSLHRSRTIHCVDLHYSSKFPSALWIVRLISFV